MRRVCFVASTFSSRRFAATAAAVAPAAVAQGARADPVTIWRQLEAQAASRLGSLTVEQTNLTSYRVKFAALPAPPTVSSTFPAAIASAKSVGELVNVYETILDTIRRVEKQRQVELLEYYGLKDAIKLGAKLTPAALEQKKVSFEKVKKAIEKITAERDAIAKANFTTASLNDLLNILRVIGHQRDDAHTLATLILDEMTGLLHVPFDQSSQLLSKAIIFGDGPTQDSGVLFSLVENPERGEVHAESGDVVEIADRVLYTIAGRHDAEITDGVKKHLNETFPMLQRSSD